MTPNSLVRQKEGAEEEDEEEVGGRLKGLSIGTPTPGADAPIDRSVRDVGFEEQEKTLTVV